MTDRIPNPLDSDRIPAAEGVSRAFELIQKRLLNAPAAISPITTHLAGATGKGIRTVLLMDCARDTNGLVPYSTAKAAAAIELLHLATLVHDDIIDDAPTRRGISSVHSKFGKKQAVICGDWLLCAAAGLVASIELSDEGKSIYSLSMRYTRTVEKICLGELEQNQHNSDVDLPLAGYLRIISKKTAALFNVAAYTGATLGECGEEQIKLLSRFAQHLGMIFQIVDDLKDYLLDEQETLKPVKSDIVSGVITLPLIMGFAKDPGLKDLALHTISTGLNAQQVIRAVRKSGGIEKTQHIARRYYQKAEAVLAKLEDPGKRKSLMSLLNHALGAAGTF